MYLPVMLANIGPALTVDIYGIITVIAFVLMLLFMTDRTDKLLLEGVKSTEEAS